MKKNILGVLFTLTTIVAFAQNGLENIIVEKYYVSTAADTVANPDGGVLPPGSVTYRIYVDMLPGYEFQAAYGVPGHEFRIETTTLFFNNEDRGAVTPSYSKTQASHNTVMLDSWLSVGAACDGYFGILKAHDDGVSTINNTYSPQVLQNAAATMGIPLTSQDGIIAVANRVPETETFVGINNEVAVFDNQNDGTNGPVFSTTNGSLASLYGSYGPDSMENQVLIAQITTNGILSFELNIQIGTPTGGHQNYVARNPVGNEIQLASLIYNSSTVDVQQPNHVSNVPSFNIYPNPVQHQLNMEIKSDHDNSPVSYVIYDEKGCMVVRKKLSSASDFHSESIDLSSLPVGEYILQLISEQSVVSKKFIKN